MDDQGQEGDAALVAAALAGDLGAFGPMIERYKDAVFAVAFARLGRFHDAEDVTQQVFIEAFERLGRLREPQRLGAWLRSMAVHRSIDVVRQRGRWVGLDDVPEPASEQGTPEEHLEQRERQAQVERVLSKLTRPQRETVALFYLGGYGRRQIAAIQQVSEDTVKSRLRAARGRLQQEMLEMVEVVLHDKGPKEDFAGRVYGLLNLYPSRRHQYYRWGETIEELRRIGAPGIEGVIRAFALPHGPTRRRAVRAVDALDCTESVIELLKKGLQDRNKKVRGGTAKTLMRLDVPLERKRREFLPLVVEMMLNDPCANVRRTLAHAGSYGFGESVRYLPAARVSHAAVWDPDPRVRSHLRVLLGRIAIARDEMR